MPVGPKPTTWMTTSPSFAQTKCARLALGGQTDVHFIAAAFRAGTLTGCLDDTHVDPTRQRVRPAAAGLGHAHTQLRPLN